MEKQVFAITFGMSHPLRDGFVAVVARDREGAEEFAHATFGDKYSFVRPVDEVKDANFFPAGQFGRTVDASQVPTTV